MTAAISVANVRKTFGPVVANRNASLEVARGEIHAVVGENGAGKSTLMRTIAGMFPPDAGTIAVEGRDVTGWTIREAIAAGVGMVHQHFMLVPTLTVAENLVLGRELTQGWQLDRRAAEREVRSLCERTGLLVAADRPVSLLSVGEAQRVEILKVLWRGARILILDEPTAVLSPPEVTELWKVLRRLRDSGDTVVVITHKLDEVMDISDVVTVMRAGETVGRIATRDATPAIIARMMVGRDVALVAEGAALGAELPQGGPLMESTGGRPDDPRSSEPARGTAAGRQPAALAVQNLTIATPIRPRAVDSVSFEIAPGEILGIAGVEGNGQTELVEAIAGLRAVSSGTIRLSARDITHANVRARCDAGLSHVPEDRHQRGLVLDYSIADNLILGQQHRFLRGRGAGTLDRSAIAANARRLITAFDVRPPNASLPARALSGGNQQKVVVAREMGRDFAVLLAAQPTRGVDVGAIEFIHARIRAARNEAKAVLLVSADLAEVLALSDRVAVMYGGRFVVVLPRAQATAEVLGRYMTGAAA
jgi:simple sugar transport system ATP-binding protein